MTVNLWRKIHDTNQNEIQHIGISEHDKINLQDQKLTKKNKRRKLVENLTKKIFVKPEDIPLDSNLFDNFVRDRIHRGLKAKDRTNLKKGDIGYADPHIHSLVKEIREINQQLRDIENSQKEISRRENILIRESIIKNIIYKAENRITESFQSISRCDFIHKIELLCGDISRTSLSINIILKNGRHCSPHSIFSEANLDLLVLLVFLSLTKEAADKGQSKLLILDDVFQSVDSTIRVSIVDYILKEFDDWQLIFTAHDRLWKSQLSDSFRRNGHEFIESEITRWSFEGGPIILNTSKDIDYILLETIDAGQVVNICSQAGLLLEEV